MHKIIEDEGIFNFVYNLPITIYSTIISFVINFSSLLSYRVNNTFALFSSIFFL